jgi:hypothetical protein
MIWPSTLPDKNAQICRHFAAIAGTSAYRQPVGAGDASSHSASIASTGKAQSASSCAPARSSFDSGGRV